MDAPSHTMLTIDGKHGAFVRLLRCGRATLDIHAESVPPTIPGTVHLEYQQALALYHTLGDFLIDAAAHLTEPEDDF